MKENLDQQRASFAWKVVKGQSEEYSKLAKGAPALIMQSGLMPVLAFFKEKEKGKKKDHYEKLLNHICEWLQKQFEKQITKKDFGAVMAVLMGNQDGDPASHARFYQYATEETLAILRWIRQFAPAVCEKENTHD